MEDYSDIYFVFRLIFTYGRLFGHLFYFYQNGRTREEFQFKMFMERLRSLQISFNPENVVCLTRKEIPISVKFTISLGPKFGFINNATDSIRWEDFNIAFDKILDQCNRFDQWFMVKDDIVSLQREMKGLIQSGSKAQIFIREQADLCRMFLKANKDIIIIPADKGGKVIVMDAELYENKIEEHLQENLKDHTYYHWKNGTIEECRRILEPKFERLRSLLEGFLEKDARNGMRSYNICSEPYIIAKLYILLKSHKDGIRPIIAALDAWGDTLSKWILEKLELIANLFSKVKVNSSEEFIEQIKEIESVPQIHKLSNWDYVSMFTNIPFQLTKKIITEHYGEIQKTTCVPVHLFLQLVSLLVEDSSYFTYKGQIYRQTKGLTMGNQLSKMLAEITTNFLSMKAIGLVEKQDITFLYKFVDDLAGAVDPKIFEMFEQVITGNVKSLKVERCDESAERSITFLDTMVIKDHENRILTRWWQKECSARQILNFHSAHPRYMKVNVVREYIRHALAVTSPILYDVTIKNLRKVLRRSSYPFGFIQDILVEVLGSIGRIHEVSTVGVYDENFDFEKELKIRTKIMEERRRSVLKFGSRSDKPKFISFPFHKPIFEKTKSIIEKHRVQCRLAPTMINTNKGRIYSKLKDKTNLADIKFGIFSLGCTECNFKRFYRTNNLDVERSINHVLQNVGSDTSKHIEEFPNHTISQLPEDVTRYRNATDLKFAYGRIVREFQKGKFQKAE